MVLTWSNLIQCGIVPGWCTVYYDIVGHPRVLIAYGNDGLGNPYKLETIFQNRDILGARTVTRNIDNITSGTLGEYDVVVVTRAKTMGVDKLQMFQDYVNDGGRLVWTGDAGTTGLLGEKDPKDYNVKNASLGWTRITNDDTILEFNNTISAEYIDNYCNIVNCSGPTAYVGNLMHNEDSIISQELLPNANMAGDFAVVKLINNTSTVKDLWLDHRADIIDKSANATDYDRYPAIIIISGLGGKTVYSAIPLEFFVDVDSDEYRTGNTGMFYATIIENLYYHLIGGDIK